MGRHGDTVGHGHGNLLVLLVACRGLGAHHLSVLLKLESLRALVVDLYVEWVNTSAIEALRRYSATQGASLTRTTSCTRDDGERPSRESAGARGRHSRAQASRESHGPPTCVRTTYPDPRWRPSKDKNGRKRVGEFLRAAAPSIFIRTGKGREAGNAVTGFACPQGDLIKSGERCVSDPSRRRYPLPPIPP